MPKSITHGPCEPSRMLLGFRSRWITDAACTIPSACAVQPISWKTAGKGSGPKVASASSRGTPGTYALAIHGWSEPMSWSTTGTMW